MSERLAQAEAGRAALLRRAAAVVRLLDCEEIAAALDEWADELEATAVAREELLL